MAEQNNIIKNKDSNQDDEIKIIEITENNKIIDEKIPENKKEEIKGDKNDNMIIIKEIEDKNNKKEKEKEKNIEEKLEMIMKELKKKDVIIKVMKDNMDIFKKKQEAEMKELKETQAKELNQLKQNYEKEINELKKNIATKEDIKYLAKRREIDFVKEDLDALNTKFSNLENEYNTKMGFIEANMEKMFKKEEDDKKPEDNNNKKNENIINNNIINNYFDNKKKRNANLNTNFQFDMKIYKDFKNSLDEIFTGKNLNDKEINKKNLEKIQKECEKLFKEKKFVFEFFNDYINNTINNAQNKLSKEQLNNLIQKKFKVFELLNQINEKMYPKLKNNIKEQKKVNINDFKINEFRKELQLSEKDYPDEVLKKAYIDKKGNLDAMVLSLFDK